MPVRCRKGGLHKLILKIYLMNLIFHSLNATDDESIKRLFQPGLQSLENYDLRLGHQRWNVCCDKYLGENNVQAGIDLFGPLVDEGPFESAAYAMCFFIRALLTLDQVSSLLSQPVSPHHF